MLDFGQGWVSSREQFFQSSKKMFTKYQQMSAIYSYDENAYHITRLNERRKNSNEILQICRIAHKKANHQELKKTFLVGKKMCWNLK